MSTARLKIVAPPALKRGDCIGIVGPASPPRNVDGINETIRVVRALGFKVRLAAHARKRSGYLAGSDCERASDLMELFGDRRVNGIMCLRGGYGSARILPLLDYATIRRNPKVFVGYSDITSLHCALLVKAGLISFHGPMLCSDWIKPQMPQLAVRTFFAAVASQQKLRISRSAEIASITTVRKGRVTGRLIGGNLSILCSTVGTPWQPPFKKAILLLEEVDEEPYRIDRSLTHLLNAGLLQQVAGIALGSFAGCTDPKATSATEYRQTVDDVLRDRLGPLGIPILAGLPFGHQPLNLTIPIGARATLDASKGELLISPAVA